MTGIDDGFDDYETTESKIKPDVAAAMLVDSSRDFQPEEVLTFFERLAEGYGPFEIGLSLGWSDAMIRRFESDPDRRALMDLIQDAEFDSLERAFKTHAKAGNSTAMKMVAYNLMGHRGWADRRQVQVTGQSQHEIVVSVKAAIEERLTAVTGADDIAQLQAAFLEPDDFAEDDIEDAEIVEVVDGGHPAVDPTDA